MITIPLSRGYIAVIDDRDSRLAKFKWTATIRASRVYAVRRMIIGGKAKVVYLHRQILLEAKEIDHIDGDGLNNRRSNLRSATHQQNCGNRPRTKKNKVGFKGVFRSSNRRDRWVAQIQLNGRSQHLGVFASPKQAALAYDRAALEAFGKFAHLNFGNDNASTQRCVEEAMPEIERRLAP